jgi:HK97 family phage prohead protease
MDRHLTPSGLRLFGADEFTTLAATQDPELADDFAVLDTVLADVKAVKGNRYRFKISTDAVDRDKDVISVAGWDLTHYKKNPIVLFAHDYRALPIGMSVAIHSTKSSLEADVEFVEGSIYPFAETVRRLVDAGVLRAASVGFKPQQYAYNDERKGVDIQKAELLEWSIVPVPANPECLVQLAAVPHGHVLDFTKGCEAILTTVKGPGQWVVQADIASLLDIEKLATQLAEKIELPMIEIAQPLTDAKSYPGCTRDGGCPTNENGSPDSCTMADCPLKSQGQVGDQSGEGKEVTRQAKEPTFIELLAAIPYQPPQVYSDEEIMTQVRGVLLTEVQQQVSTQVLKQLNYMRGRIE